MGSKSKIAADIVATLPPADTFVDLFAGGCAITHATPTQLSLFTEAELSGGTLNFA